MVREAGGELLDLLLLPPCLRTSVFHSSVCPLMFRMFCSWSLIDLVFAQISIGIIDIIWRILVTCERVGVVSY